MARILILGQNWADLVMAGEKCIELRKTRISSCKQPEMMYLGVKDTIFARCLVCPGVKIENEEQFNMLRNGHRWEGEKLPYGFPFMGHALLQVQALKPVEFQRVWGTIGRALYRPPGFVGLPEDGEEEGKGEATSSKGNVAKKKGSQKEKTGKNTTKTKQNQIKCLPPSALEGQTVETVEPTEHLQPSSQRLEAKQKQLQRKRDADKADVHISGGALAHLNNLAFPRGPSKTAAYLLGEVGKKKSVSVKSLWIPSWEAQGEMEKWTVKEAGLKKWAKTFRPALAVVGLCLVVPDQDTPEVSALMAFDQILKEASPKELIFGLVGKDKYCKMYHIVEDVAQELHLEVHWVGDASLYTAHVVAQELEVFEKVREQAKASIEKKGVCQSVQAKKKQQNEKRKPPQEDSEETRVTAEVSLRKIAEQLQNLAIFLLENLQNFNQERDASMQSKYAECLAAYPLAQLELSKVTPKSSMCPESVQEAGQRMAIREMDRLIESGQTTGIEKAVMKTFPAIFCGLKGNKSGMLGRWKTQCDKQRWREIPFEKLSVADRQMKELPDWVRIPLGLVPRNLERFREGGQVPVCIVNQLVDLVEKLTTGCNSAALTTGTLNSKQIQKEAERLLKIYNKAQEEAAEAAGKPVPLAKTKISDRWANRLLVNYGWKRHAPNTYGAYLAYDDERMVKSRKMFGFRRLANNIRLDLCINFDQAFDQRRRVLGERYGQSFESEWGLILCDSFTGHHSTSGGADVQRSQEVGLHEVNRAWAWLSRGMATYDDMQEFNPGIEGMDKESLKKEMSACELNAENSETWTSSIEEVFMQPDVQRTTFLWQIDLKSEAEVAWEDEEEDQELNWRCLPAHWQAILNSRLAEFNSKIQDAEAFYLHRKGEFGEGDVKTKNALKKWESLKEGEGASSVILIAKGTGKEASPEVYHRAVSRSKGVVKVQCGPKITAYKLNVKEMNLDEGGFEAAEDGLEANIPIDPEEEEHNAKESINVDKGDDFPCFGQSQDDASDEEIVYEFKDCDAAFECVATEATSSSEPAPVGVSPAGTIKTMAAFMFLEQVGLSEIPNVPGVGMGVHTTTQCWQIRYPRATGKQSAGRCWGDLKKKGFVPPCRALLECLLWCWEVHLAENPTCAVSAGKIQLLKGAIKADLGRDVK
ncbi:unnamed protein product [Cladocopium goreaui]|uniref:Uncharacterized protein n=1 Tax=Cladocopium goreaui TaxID=2562237 RepID=A0A9P1BGW2_9DINO|nr:unnamed protein product [Cladocopium goreaui]